MELPLLPPVQWCLAMTTSVGLLGSATMVRGKLKPQRRTKRAHSQGLNVEELFNTKDTSSNLADYGRQLVDTGDRFLAARVLEQSVRNWVEEKELEKEQSKASPGTGPLSVSPSRGQSNKKMLQRIEKQLAPEDPELAGVVHLMMHMLVRNKDWSNVISMADFILENEDLCHQLTEGDRDHLRLRKAVASHMLELRKSFGTGLAFDQVKTHFQEAHPGYHSKLAASRGLKHLAFLEQQAAAAEQKVRTTKCKFLPILPETTPGR